VPFANRGKLHACTLPWQPLVCQVRPLTPALFFTAHTHWCVGCCLYYRDAALAWEAAFVELAAGKLTEIEMPSLCLLFPASCF